MDCTPQQSTRRAVQSSSSTPTMLLAAQDIPGSVRSTPCAATPGKANYEETVQMVRLFHFEIYKVISWYWPDTDSWVRRHLFCELTYPLNFFSTVGRIHSGFRLCILIGKIDNFNFLHLVCWPSSSLDQCCWGAPHPPRSYTINAPTWPWGVSADDPPTGQKKTLYEEHHTGWIFCSSRHLDITFPFDFKVMHQITKYNIEAQKDEKT